MTFLQAYRYSKNMAKPGRWKQNSKYNSQWIYVDVLKIVESCEVKWSEFPKQTTINLQV